MTDVKEAVTYQDSQGNELTEGSTVYVSTEVARSHWNYDTQERVPGRTFDFGEVVELNEDGTVSVSWDSAGCGCGDSEGRTENPGDLTKVDEDLTEEFREVFYLAEIQGYHRGVKDNQRDLRDALGLSHPSDQNEN